MSIFKCKMCGGTIEFEQGATVGVCDSCGTKQTLPRLDDDRKTNLYDRANHFRRNNDFDKAAGIYESILNEDTTDAEAYWSLVLCQYGIEYVEDPATHKRVPTVNRAQFTSIFDDDNYKSALKYADSFQRSIYESEANAINEIQKGILAISQKEEPFDVFICYKETDNNGRRTPDSVLANDLYHLLIQEGFKVFFSRITLEDKLGTAYEPYIFAALNSAKVMVVLGTKPEYFNAVWVKNEWSRYLSLVKQSGGKKMLIPAYKDMDPYDLPEEFSHLQAQDMSKLGFMQDLIRGIKKLTAKDTPTPTVVKETIVREQSSSGGANVSALLKRAFMFLEDGEWASADEYAEKVLDIDPENGEAYLAKLMSELHVKKQDDLPNCERPFDNSNNYQKAVRFGGESLANELKEYLNIIFKRIEINRKEQIYLSAKLTMKDALTIKSFKVAIEKFESIKGYKDTNEKITICKGKIKELEEKEEADRLERERQAEQKRIAAEKAAKKRKKIIAITTPIIVACIAFVIVLTTVIIPNQQYKEALGKYSDSIKAASVGDTIKFGYYEQDNNTSNGKEAIEWIVLAKDDDKALVISKYALDCQRYNSAYTSVTWETCSLRKWMNGTFLNAAFDSGEQRLIQKSTVTADKNPSYSTSPGNNTTDKVFLLSITEANKYFSSDSARQCSPTAYAKAQSAYTNTSDVICCWWLRTPGYLSCFASYVDYNGIVSYDGSTVNYYNGVRPAMWIDLSK